MGGSHYFFTRNAVFSLFFPIEETSATCLSTFTWIPGHDEDWAKAMAERFANTNTANNRTHRTPMGIPTSGSLTVEATADF